MPRVIDTDRYLRFERVDAVEETARGLLATLHGERLRLDVVARRRRAREDQPRRRLRRDADVRRRVGPAGRTPVEFTVERGRRRRPRAHRGARRLAVARPVPPRRPPPRRQPGRRDRPRRRRPLLGLRDAERRVHRAPPLPPRGRRSTAWARRPGATTAAAATSRCGTPTSSTRTRRPSSRRAGRPATRAATSRAPSSTRTTSRSRSSTTRRTRPARSRRRSSTTATAPRTSSRARRSTASTSRAGSTPSTSSPGPGCRTSSRPTRALTGRTAPPPLWALGYHQCRWFDYTQDAVEALGERHRDRAHPVRRAVARHRVHGRLPRVHLGHGDVPGRAGHARPPRARRASASITIVDPGVKYDPGYAGLRPGASSATCCAAPRAATSTSARSGRATRRSPTSSREEGRAWWGELNADHVALGRRRDLERHERAGDRRASRRSAMRFDHGRVSPRALPQPVRAADGDGHDRRAARRDARPAHVRPHARRVRRHPALRRELDGRQPSRAGTTSG